MNSVEYYNHSKFPWTDDEVEEIKKEYEEDLLNILQIADKHRRTPGCIAYKLKHIESITHNSLARGYDEYKGSKLYMEICKNSRKEDAEKKQMKEIKEKEKALKQVKEQLNTNNTIKANIMLDVITVKGDVMLEIKSMKQEIADMKKDIKQMLEYITSIYEFEKQE